MNTDTSSPTRVLVLTDSEETAQLLPGLLAGAEDLEVQTGPAAPAEALQEVAEHAPHVVVIADTHGNPAVTVAALDAAAPDLPQLVILAEGDLRAAEACALVGARASLFKPFEQQRLLDAVQQLRVRALRRPPPPPAAPDSGAAGQQLARVVAVHGVKGGVGATTLACNLAVALRHLTGQHVAFVDADMLSGDARVLFDMPPTRTIAELIPELQGLDAELVDGFFHQHDSGVRVLLAPEQLQRAEAIQPEDVQRVLRGLRSYFPCQVVDTPAGLELLTLAILDEADLIILVVTPDLVALRDAARFLRLAAQLGYPNDKILLVANHADAGEQIKPAMIEKQLQRPVVVPVPSDRRALLQAMNTGVLIVDARPDNHLSEAIELLARETAMRFGWMPRSQEEPAPAARRAAAPQARSAGAGASPTAAPAPAVDSGSLLDRLTRWLPVPRRQAPRPGP